MVGLRRHARDWCRGRAETAHWGMAAVVPALQGRVGGGDGRQGTAAGPQGGGGGGGVLE